MNPLAYGVVSVLRFYKQGMKEKSMVRHVCVEFHPHLETDVAKEHVTIFP